MDLFKRRMCYLGYQLEILNEIMQMSEALEAKVEAHMHESVQAAQAAAEAEARAASMHDAMMSTLREQQAAEARAALLETKIREEVSVRLRAIGADRMLWPQVHAQHDMHACTIFCYHTVFL